MQEPDEGETQESDEETTEKLPEGRAKNDTTAAEKSQKDEVKSSEERGSKKGERTIEEDTIEVPKSESQTRTAGKESVKTVDRVKDSVDWTSASSWLCKHPCLTYQNISQAYQ